MSNHYRRWLYISALKHFEDKIVLVKIYEKPPKGQTSWAEFRFTEYSEDEQSVGVTTITVHLDILITADVDGDRYLIYRILDEIKNNFSCICCFRYGDGENDDQTFIGELRTITPIDMINWGFVDSSSELQRESISADFLLHLA